MVFKSKFKQQNILLLHSVSTTSLTLPFHKLVFALIRGLFGGFGNQVLNLHIIPRTDRKEIRQLN